MRAKSVYHSRPSGRLVALLWRARKIHTCAQLAELGPPFSQPPLLPIVGSDFAALTAIHLPSAAWRGQTRTDARRPRSEVYGKAPRGLISVERGHGSSWTRMSCLEARTWGRVRSARIEFVGLEPVEEPECFRGPRRREVNRNRLSQADTCNTYRKS